MALNIETRFEGASAIKEAFPAGFVNPDFTIVFVGDTIDETLTLDIDEGAIPNADAAVGLEALRVAIESEIQTNQVPNVLGLETTVNTVDMTVEVESVSSKNDRASKFNPADLKYSVVANLKYQVS